MMKNISKKLHFDKTKSHSKLKLGFNVKTKMVLLVLE